MVIVPPQLYTLFLLWFVLDVTSPKIICPENITTNTLLGKKYGHVVWIEPNATDNSGLQVTVWKIPVIENIPEFKFQIGRTPITYFAQDAYHNKAKCTFYVTVKDDEPPTIEDCVSPPTFLSSDPNGANVTWDAPNIYDNSQKT
ncbi:hypothetical protein NQ318_009330 [Aromia moschata]|uniref:HYR domain-containing protein n=1 Tax=Aromia moschata TaxID=1265417 RepID=A0AAV8XMW0_9CUCU|nr:hypothetical protein NQ318_009330 [Aromia moschata]